MRRGLTSARFETTCISLTPQPPPPRPPSPPHGVGVVVVVVGSFRFVSGFLSGRFQDKEYKLRLVQAEKGHAIIMAPALATFTLDASLYAHLGAG